MLKEDPTINRLVSRGKTRTHSVGMVCRRKKSNDSTRRSIACPCSRCVWLRPAAADDPDLRKFTPTLSRIHSTSKHLTLPACLSVWTDTQPECRARSGVGGNLPTGRGRYLLKKTFTGAVQVKSAEERLDRALPQQVR